MSEIIATHDDPMVISTIMVNAEVKRVFIDRGSLVDIIFQEAFDKLDLHNADLQSYPEELKGFSREKVHPDRFVTPHLTVGAKPLARTIKVDFLVVDYPSAYNFILDCSTLNKIEVVISTSLLTMKFVIDNRKVRTIKAN